MDFVARAGSYIDRAHRIAGLLLVCCGVLGLLVMCQAQENSRLNSELVSARQRMPVIVVPGAVAGKYDPREDAQLVAAFTDFITQTFNTFTPLTLSRQLQSARAFFSPTLLVDSQPYFEKKLRDTMTVQRSSLFVPDRDSLTVRVYEHNGVQFRDVKLRGVLQNIASGTVAESLPVEISMTIRKTIINPDINPYGYELVTYFERPITPQEQAEPLIDTSGPSGQ